MSSLRVFVVDPDEQRGAWIEALATAHGHDVERFRDGEKAIDRFVVQPADVLIVEYALPGRDGVATAESIRWAPRGRDVKVVLLAKEEPITAPLSMLARRVDAVAALVGPLKRDAFEQILVDLDRDRSSEGTVAVDTADYAAELTEARRRSRAPTVPLGQGWFEVATVFAGVVRVESAERDLVDEPTACGDDPALVSAVRDLRTTQPSFDDATLTEPGSTASGTSPALAQPIDASVARAILGMSGSKRVDRFAASRPDAPSSPTRSRFASVRSAASPIRAFATPPAAAVPLDDSARPAVVPPAPSGHFERAGSTLDSPEPPSHRPWGSPPTSAAAPSERLAVDPALPPPRASSDGPKPLASEDRVTTELMLDPQTIDEGRFVRAAARRRTEADRSGHFADVPFPALLREIAEARVSGGLVCTGLEAACAGSAPLERPTVDGEAPTKIVFFRSGVPVLVRSNVLDECLGQMLLRRKRIGVATLEESIRRMRETGELQGRTLVEMGALSPLELGELLAEQARQKLYDLFGWRDGEFRFSSTMEVPRDGVGLEMALPDMIYEGVCAAMSATTLLDLMTPRLDRFVVPDPVRLARFARVRIAEDLRAVLARIDGSLRLRDVLRLGARPGAIAQMVYALESLGAVGYEDAARVANASDPWPRAATEGEARRAAPESSPRAAARWEEVTRPRPHRRLESGSGELARATAPASPPEVSLSAAGSDPRAHAGGRERHDLDTHVDRMFEAERNFRRGSRWLARGEPREALRSFERAVELCPEEGEFVAYLGWARHAAMPDDPSAREAALADLARATALAPDLHVTHLLHARVLESAGCFEEARRAYESALRLEPTLSEASAALARLDLPSLRS